MLGKECIRSISAADEGDCRLPAWMGIDPLCQVIDIVIND
jgi:hypothetical protein